MSMTPPSRTDINRVGNVFIELSPDLEPLRIARINAMVGSTSFRLFSRISLDCIIQEEDECTSYMLIPHPEKEGFFAFDGSRTLIAPYNNLFVQADDALWHKALRIMGLNKTVFVNRFARLQSEYVKQDLIAVCQQLSVCTAFPAQPLPLGYYLVKGPSYSMVCKLLRECGYGLDSGETIDGIDAGGGKRMFFTYRYKTCLPQTEGIYIDLPPQGIGPNNVNSCAFYFPIPQSAYDDVGSLLSSYRDAQLRLLKPYLAAIDPVPSN